MSEHFEPDDTQNENNWVQVTIQNIIHTITPDIMTGRRKVMRLFK